MWEFDKVQTVNEGITLNFIFFWFFPYLYLSFSTQNGLQICNLEQKIHQLKKRSFYMGLKCNITIISAILLGLVHELEQNWRICSQMTNGGIYTLLCPYRGVGATQPSPKPSWVRIIALYLWTSKKCGCGAHTSNADHYHIQLLQKRTSLCPYGGAPPSQTLWGLG